MGVLPFIGWTNMVWPKSRADIGIGSLLSETFVCSYNCAIVGPRALHTGCPNKNAIINNNKTISDGGITVDFWIIKVHTSN